MAANQKKNVRWGELVKKFQAGEKTGVKAVESVEETKDELQVKKIPSFHSQENLRVKVFQGWRCGSRVKCCWEFKKSHGENIHWIYLWRDNWGHQQVVEEWERQKLHGRRLLSECKVKKQLGEETECGLFLQDFF